MKHQKKRKKKIESPIKSGAIKRYLDASIPAPLRGRYFGQIGVFAVMMVVGIVCMIALRSFSAGLFPILMGLAFLVLAVTFKLSIMRGYTTIEGIIVERTRFVPGRDATTADGFNLRTADNKTIHIPATRRKNSLAVGSVLRVYLSDTSSEYVNRHGVIAYGNILGYEVIGAAQQNDI